MHRPRSALGAFLRTEAGGGVVLLAATVVALIWANSPWQGAYDDLWHHELVVGPGGWAVRESLQHWVNGGLMAVFFFVVGLEIKREATSGELRNARTAVVPGLAAAGGMVLPALLFLIVAGPGEAARGWAIPMATDIAFAVGVLSLLGNRVPRGLKVFLLTLAIVDDIGAIVVVAVFYAEPLEWGWVLAAGVVFALVGGARRVVTRPGAYVPLAIGAWYCTYRAGIHPTLAGVALALLTPPDAAGLERRLHPVSSYLIVPLFALANAGVALSGDRLAQAAGSRLTWAVIVGLVVGKLAGIAGAAALAVRTGLGQLPLGVTTRHVAGAAALGGIGFTVSLFITGLAYTDAALLAEAKVGLLAGSLISALLGAAILSRS